jgi:hypothetical protein
MEVEAEADGGAVHDAVDDVVESLRMTRTAGGQRSLCQLFEQPAEKAIDVSSPGPGTRTCSAMAPHRLSPQITMLVATMAPQANATSTMRHWLFSFRSSRLTTEQAECGGGEHAAAQIAATRAG